MPQPNLNKMMKQVQEMQAEMMKAQEQLKNEVVEASAGGGMVTVKISGDLELKEIRIDPNALGGGEGAVDADDIEMLQDMVLAAVNEAIRSAQELAGRRLGGVTGGLGDLGNLGGLGLPGM
jgi:DNA-binding YbaB/EbfC family protein